MIAKDVEPTLTMVSSSLDMELTTERIIGSSKTAGEHPGENKDTFDLLNCQTDLGSAVCTNSHLILWQAELDPLLLLDHHRLLQDRMKIPQTDVPVTKSPFEFKVFLGISARQNALEYSKIIAQVRQAASMAKAHVRYRLHQVRSTVPSHAILMEPRSVINKLR